MNQKALHIAVVAVVFIYGLYVLISAINSEKYIFLTLGAFVLIGGIGLLLKKRWSQWVIFCTFFLLFYGYCRKLYGAAQVVWPNFSVSEILRYEMFDFISMLIAFIVAIYTHIFYKKIHNQADAPDRDNLRGLS